MTKSKIKITMEPTSRLFFAARNGNLADAQTAFDGGAKADTRDEFQRTPLHVAAGQGHADVVKLLIDKGADVNAQASDGCSPLHFAAYTGHSEIAKLLTDKGANVGAKDTNKQTALDYAIASSDRANIINLLMTSAKQQGHASRVTKGRKDKGPPQVGG